MGKVAQSTTTTKKQKTTAAAAGVNKKTTATTKSVDVDNLKKLTASQKSKKGTDPDTLTDLDDNDDDNMDEYDNIQDMNESPADPAPTAPTAPTAPAIEVPEWFKQYQLATDARFKHFEAIIAENTRLRAELVSTQAALAMAKAEIDKLKSSTTASTARFDSPNGTMASKFAHIPDDTEFPSVHAANSQSSTAGASQPTASGSETYASQAAKNTSRKKVSAKAKAKATEVFMRLFTPLPETQGFTYVYFPCRARQRASVMRNKLRGAGIESARVLDVSYPAKKVVAFLVHNDYVGYLTDQFGKAGVKPLLDFNPLLVDDVLKDSPLENDKDLLRADKHKLVYKFHLNRCLRALDYLRKPVCYAVANDFLSKGWITAEHVTKLQNGERLFTATKDTTEGADTAMDDIADLFNAGDDTLMETATATTATTAPPSGDGEPAKSQ